MQTSIHCQRVKALLHINALYVCSSYMHVHLCTYLLKAAAASQIRVPPLNLRS